LTRLPVNIEEISRFGLEIIFLYFVAKNYMGLFLLSSS